MPPRRLALATALLAFAGPAMAEAPKAMVVTPLTAADFRPVLASRPEGPAMAVLRGDPAKGPSAMLLRMPKGVGAAARPHARL